MTDTKHKSLLLNSKNALATVFPSGMCLECFGWGILCDTFLCCARIVLERCNAPTWSGSSSVAFLCSHSRQLSAEHEHVAGLWLPHILWKTCSTSYYTLVCDVMSFLHTLHLACVEFKPISLYLLLEIRCDKALLHLEWQGLALYCTASDTDIWGKGMVIRSWEQWLCHWAQMEFCCSGADISWKLW
jgi:hypothetical protein